MASNNVSDVPISLSDSGSAENITKAVRVERELIVFPAHPSHRHRINLSAFDLPILLIEYTERGLLYNTPAHDFSSAVTHLQQSLSQVLTTFYPLAGRLATSPSDGAIYIDCNDAGAAFIEASAENLTTADLIAGNVDQLFTLNGAFNIEGHRVPLLAVQVTKLLDGIFLACSLNHAVVDGASLWHFFNAWAEICSGRTQNVSINPIYDRSAISSGTLVRLNLDHNAVMTKISRPPLRTKTFHFTKETLNALKDRANSARDSLHPISSLQALCGHVWQAVTLARKLDRQDSVMFQVAVDCRSRLVPPLPSSYFGNAVQTVFATSTAWEVASNKVSFPAQLLHGIVQKHDDMSIKSKIDRWEKNPKVPSWETLLKASKNILHLGGSSRFKVYETDFGWGKPVVARAGRSHRTDGKLTLFPGRDQDGSLDLEICLVPDTMQALENDQRFFNPHIPGSLDGLH